MKTKTLTVANRIAHLRPCGEAVDWASGYTSPTKAWRECIHGDWMLWLLGRLSGVPESPARRKLVRCCADCAEVSLPIFERQYPHDSRVRDCIAACRQWADGHISIIELYAAANAANAAYAAANAAANAANAAYYAAYAAANAASNAAAYAASNAAANAADAADYAAYAADAADAADYAADAAYYAANAAAYAANARTQTLAECADIVRQHYPKPPRLVNEVCK